MQNSTRHAGAAGPRIDGYRERLGPSLWILVAAALAAPMVALVLTPVDTTVALVIGVAVGVLLVGSAWDPSETRRREDRDAVAAGVQNLLLAATAAGLASHWATGDWMDDPEVKAFAGLAADDQLVALVYLGWPSGEVAPVERPEPPVTRIEL